METQSATADQIRAEMRSIRRDLRTNVNGMVENANQLLDWKSYVRSFPWASVAVAGVLGYLLVPRRMKVVAYDKETLENFLRERELAAAPLPSAQPGILGRVLPMLAGVALRFGVSYAARLGTEFLSGLSQEQEQPPAAHSRNGNSPAPPAFRQRFSPVAEIRK